MKNDEGNIMPNRDRETDRERREDDRQDADWNDAERGQKDAPGMTEQREPRQTERGGSSERRSYPAKPRKKK